MKYIVFLPIFFLFSCGNNQEETSPVESSITESIYASGSLEGRNQYTAYATASGIVHEIYFMEGDSIYNRSPILSISSVAQQLNKENAKLVAAFQDISSNQGKLREAKQRIELARSKMMNDSIQYGRQKKLNERGVGAAFELEATELSYKNSKVSYVSAKENYNNLKRQLELNSRQAKNNLKLVSSTQNDFTLKSLLDGELYSLNVEVGEIISPQTPIAVLGEKNEFVLKMEVDEYDINSVEKGQKIMVVLNSDRTNTYEATLTRVYPMMNVQSKTFLVEAEFVTRPQKLYPNVTFEANIIIESKENALLIPREYLIDKSYVMNDNGDKIKVKTGLMDFNQVEIIEGLSKSDVIVKPAE